MITGLKARGNIEVDIIWKDGELVKIGLRSPLNQLKKVVYKDKEVSVPLHSNETVWLDNNLIMFP